MKLKNLLLIAAFSQIKAAEEKTTQPTKYGYKMYARLGVGLAFTPKPNKKYKDLEQNAKDMVDRWAMKAEFLRHERVSESVTRHVQLDDGSWHYEVQRLKKPEELFRDAFDTEEISLPGYQIPISVVGTYGTSNIQLEMSFEFRVPRFTAGQKLGLIYQHDDFKVKPFIGYLLTRRYEINCTKKAYEKSDNENEKSLARTYECDEHLIGLVGLALEYRILKTESDEHSIWAFAEYEYQSSILMPSHVVNIGLTIGIFGTNINKSV